MFESKQALTSDIKFSTILALTVVISALLGNPVVAENSYENSPKNLSLPTIGNSSSSLVSIDQERKLGKAWLRALRKQVTTFDNAIIEEYLSHLIYSLAPNSTVIDRDFSLVMVDSPALNAFAVPGSVIGINAGLFLHAISEQEFASVVAHELAHLGQRHYARKLEQQQISAPLTLAGVLASVVLAATTGSDAGIAALATTQAINADQQLSFSRQNEQEADRLGISTLYNSGYDPRSMPIMFERMYKSTRLQGGAIPEYLSTHPLSESRISDTRNRATQYKVQNYSDNIEYHISKNIIVSHYAESKKGAIDYFNSLIDKGNTSQVEAAEFGLAYASLSDAPQNAIKILSSLIEKSPNRISYLVTLSKALNNNKQSQQAIETLQTLLARNPNNYPALDSLAEIYLQNNFIKEAERTLKKLVRLQAENPRIWYALAEIHGLAGNIVDLHKARAEYFFLTDHLDDAIQQLKLALQKSKDKPQDTAQIQQRINELNWLKNNPVF